MKIGIVTPAPSGSTYGNRITALRWSNVLRTLGHRVSIAEVYEDQNYDLLIALHARRSYSSINRFYLKNPETPIVLALTGTDLYRDIQEKRQAQKSLELATRIVVLQPKALEKLSYQHRRKARVIYQSVEDIGVIKGAGGSPVRVKVCGRVATISPPKGFFDVCVIGHLRAVKDPFRTAMAARLLPSSSHIRVLHIGGAMTALMEKRACAETLVNPRYFWLGEQSRTRTMRALSQSQVCVLSSKMEGGANVISEAVVAGVPVLASRIKGNIGLLGKTYPGYFDPGDTRQLSQLLIRAETDPGFMKELRAWCAKLAPQFDPANEKRAWAELLSII